MVYINRTRKLGSFVTIALVFSILLVMFYQTTAAKSESLTKEMIYVSGIGKAYAIDPIKKEVVAEIPINGAAREMTWTEDGHTLFISGGGRQEVAIVDTATNKVKDKVTFNKPDEGIISRIYGLTVDSKGEKLYATLMRTQRKTVELVPLQPVIAVMDVSTKKITKEYEVPYGTHALQFLEDESKLMVWSKNLLQLDLKTGELTKFHELMEPTDPNTQGIANYLYFWSRDRDSANSLTAGMFKFYPDTEAVSENVLMVDRTNGEVTDVQLAEPLGLFSAVVSPDKKYIYGGQNYIHKINIETKKSTTIMSERGTSYGYNISGDGKTLYVSGAGPDISFIDTETMEYIKILDLPSDTMDVRVVQIK